MFKNLNTTVEVVEPVEPPKAKFDVDFISSMNSNSIITK